MPAGDQDTIRKTENFVESLVDGEVVLMDIDNGRFFSLETTGRRIWELLDDYPTIGALTSKLLSEYDVSEDQCRSQIATLIDDFATRNMVEVDAK